MSKRQGDDLATGVFVVVSSDKVESVNRRLHSYTYTGTRCDMAHRNLPECR